MCAKYSSLPLVIAVLFVLTLILPANATQLQVAYPEIGFMNDHDLSDSVQNEQRKLIHLHSTIIDPEEYEETLVNTCLQNLVSIQKESQSSYRHYYLMQFISAVQEDWKSLLKQEGVTFYDYIPEYCFLVGMDSALKDLVMEKYTFVRWIGDYVPYFKFSRQALRDYKESFTPAEYADSEQVKVFKTEKVAGEPKKYLLICYPDIDVNEVEKKLSEVGATEISFSISDRDTTFKVTIAPSELDELSLLNDIKFIEPEPEWQLWNNRAVDAPVCNVKPVWDILGLHGENQLVAIADTGLDNGFSTPAQLHNDFEDGAGNSRVIGISDWSGDGPQDENGHGTHVAGSVLGNGLGSGSTPEKNLFPSSCFSGAAPKASLAFQAIGDSNGSLVGIPADLNTLFQEMYNAGARIHTNSWGAPYQGAYTSSSEDVDEFVWKQSDMTILFAAGNSGYDFDQNGVIDIFSMGSPATAKNCITVGASENNRPEIATTYSGFGYTNSPFNTDSMTNNIAGMSAFSSRGPCWDGRIKPDITAPGTYILSTRSSLAKDASFWANYNASYAYMGGTSMATPLTCGMVAIIRQWLGNNGFSSPSAALIKAVLLNGALEMYPGQYGTGLTKEIPSNSPNDVEGWGLVNLGNSIAGQTTMIIADAQTINQGETHTYKVNANSSVEPLKAKLVWSDYPGSPLSNGGLVNNLDLEIIAPGATTLYPANPRQPHAAQQLANAASYDTGIFPTNNGDGLAAKFSLPRYPYALSFIQFLLVAPTAGTYYLDINIYGENISGMPGTLLGSGNYIPINVSTYDSSWSAYVAFVQIPVVGITINDDVFFVEIRWSYGLSFYIASGSITPRTGNDFYYLASSATWSALAQDNLYDFGIEVMGICPVATDVRDSINNVEGIKIDSPTVGQYEVRVKGTSINKSTQKYALVITGDVSLQTLPLPHYTFDSGTDGWTFTGGILGFTIPSSTVSGGHIGLTAAGSNNCFGYWTSPYVTISNGKNYRSRWLVSSSTTDPNQTVQFRLRLNQPGTWAAWERVINSNLGMAPSSSSHKLYNLLFDPVVTGSSDDKVNFSFDILSFDPMDDENSWIYLEEFLLEEVTVTP